MVLKIFRKSTSITINLIRKLALLSVVILLFVATGCTKKDYPNPTSEFYVNDFANAFHPVTSNTILIEGERLYEETKDIPEIGGLQIVFATFIVETVDDIAKYSATDIYRQWQIGKNDMGVLVLLFFNEGEEDGVDYIYLEQTQFEIGYRMEQYLTAGVQGRLLDNTVYGDTYDDLDMNVAYLLYELMKIAYEEVYSEYYNTYSYDMDYFQQTMENYEYEPDYGYDFGIIAWLIMMFTGSGSGKWFIIIPLSLIFLGGIFGRRNRGAGGSSGGYGIFRRR